MRLPVLLPVSEQANRNSQKSLAVCGVKVKARQALICAGRFAGTIFGRNLHKPRNVLCIFTLRLYISLDEGT
jgi:hypothetical protein